MSDIVYGPLEVSPADGNPWFSWPEGIQVRSYTSTGMYIDHAGRTVMWSEHHGKRTERRLPRRATDRLWGGIFGASIWGLVRPKQRNGRRWNHAKHNWRRRK